MFHTDFCDTFPSNAPHIRKYEFRQRIGATHSGSLFRWRLPMSPFSDGQKRMPNPKTRIVRLIC